MKLCSRIQAARRLQDMTQTDLARLVGVQRSAVSHWESPLGKNPTVGNLRKIAKVTGVGFEWLATGRGRMTLSSKEALDGMPAALAELIDDDAEIRLVRAFREAPAKARAALLELAEQIAVLRTGKRRNTKV